MNKVLYISYDGMTDNLGQSQVIPYLKGLSKKGYQFTILSFEKKDRFTEKKNLIYNLLQALGIKWEPKNYTSSPPVLSTIKDILVLINSAKKLHLDEQFDIVHCRSYISAFAGIYLKRKFGLKFIFDMRGFWADERVEGNVWNLKNPIFKLVYKYFKTQENKYLNSSDYTISLTNTGKDIIHKLKHVNNQPIRIEVIPCCADFNHFKRSVFQKDRTQQLAKILNIQASDFIVSYLGSVGTWYMLDEMLDFFKVLKSQKPKAKFLFITTDSEHFIKSAAQNRGVDINDIIVMASSRKDVPLFIALSNVALFFIKPVFSKSASSPTKMAEIMGMGIPVICNNNVGDVESIIENTKAGLLVKNFNNQEYLTVINKINNLLELDRDNIRESAMRYFSLTSGVDKYAHVYNTVLNK